MDENKCNTGHDCTDSVCIHTNQIYDSCREEPCALYRNKL